MKKLVLSLAVIGSFLLYSFHEKNEQAEAVVPKATPDPVSASFRPASGDTATPTPTATAQTAGTYRDGEYTGDSADAYYGNIQVKAVISGGKITDVQFLQYPNDRGTSIRINGQAMPYLKQEAIQAQNANVDIVTGATDSSQAFIQSLGSALARAK